MRFFKLQKILICLAFLCVCPVFAYADVSCPAGYVAVNEDAVYVSTSGSCPAGHTQLGGEYGVDSIINCIDGLENGDAICTFFDTACQSGKYFDGTSFQTCLAGTYCDGTGTATPGTSGCSVTCPENSTSASGASYCTCNTGYNYNGGTTTTTNACVPNIYTVTYDCNGGVGDTSVSAVYNGDFTVQTGGCSRDGYTFDRWTLDGNDISGTFTWTYTSDKTLIAQWKGVEYLITFDSNGGESVENKAYTSADSFELPVPIRDGYVFAGWTENGDIITEIITGTTGNKTLVAQWDNCGKGNWCADGIQTSCTTYGVNYTTKFVNATRASDCYQECTVLCTQQTCPSNAICTHGTSSTLGEQYYGDSCKAEPSTCSLDFTCDENFVKVDGGCSLQSEFTIETTDMNAGTVFSFEMSASGIFWVDFDDGRGAIKIDRTNNTSNEKYSSVAYADSGTHTIKMSGDATGYSAGNAVIRFNSNKYIKSLGGSLGAIFGGNSNSMFHSTFHGCSSLESISPTLFDGVYGNAEYMFSSTFNDCTSLKSVPSGLFSGISGSANNMFAYTFNNCTSLESVAPDLFSGVSGGANSMFHSTFYRCMSLKSIPATLFNGVSSSAEYMFDSTFHDCAGLTSLPDGLFQNITGKPAERMFQNTFAGCTNMAGYVPMNTFAKMDGTGYTTGPMNRIFDNTALDTQCPDGTAQYITGFESDWSGKVACAPCPDGYTSDAGATSQNQCYTTCTTDCVQPTCPENATCAYGNETATGTQNWGGTCNAVAPTCSMTITCNDGYMLVNGECIKPEFTITTTEMAVGSTFSFNMSAKGTFWVDFDDGRGAIKIDRTNNTSNTTYTSAAYSTAGTHTIKMYGDATGYTTSSYTAAISFRDNTKIKRVDGSLGAIFGGNTPNMFYSTFYNCTSLTSIPENLFAGVSGSAPHMFHYTFSGCTSLTSIPETLFAGVSGSAPHMFYETFSVCTSLTSIPENLFAGVSGSASYMFSWTFRSCTSLTSIPENLFAGVSGSAEYMFGQTFINCTSLTSIPENLFAGVSGSAEYMFSGTFNYCTSLTSIPEKLFAGVSGSASNMFNYTFGSCTSLTSIPENLFAGVSGSASYMFYATFYNCTSLTSIPEKLFAGVTGSASYMFSWTFGSCTSLTSLPDGLFKNIEGKPADSMFQQTFYDCTKLSGYIPANTFAKMDSTDFSSATMSGIFNNTTLATTCPAGTTQYITGFESAWNGKVACTPCPESHPNSVAGSTSQNQCYTSCTVDCTQPATCPENATCEYGSETATGTQNWGGTCNAVAPTCSVTITCNAGYWLNGNTCEICPVGSYCANNIKTECDAGYTTDAPGATAQIQCVSSVKLHIGDDVVMNLVSARPTTSPVMVFQVGDTSYYAPMSATETPINSDTNVKYRVLYNETEYWVHDYTAQ